jgi:putative hydrolase
VLTNAQLAELLARAAENEEGHRQRALRRASRRAFSWPEEATRLLERGRPLTDLPAVGPWVARTVVSWIESPPEVPEPPLVRRGFLTLSRVRAVLADHPEWRSTLRADLQMHTTYSDGSVGIREMIEAAAPLGYQYVGITDHSKGLKIARGMNEAKLARQVAEIVRVNAELRAAGYSSQALPSI